MSNSQNSYNTAMPTWLVLIVACCSLWPQHSTHSTPIQTRRTHIRTGCPHDSIGELIKSSPVILKALAARIFTDDDLNAFQQQQQQLLQMQLHTGGANAKSTFFYGEQTSSSSRVANDGGTTTMPNMMTSPRPAESLLITLTPETIYKGASLLKVTPNAGGGDDGTRNGGFVSGDSAWESAYQYEGQLNATLQPLACFDGNVVKMLPSVLIAFGKLVTVQQQHKQLFHAQQQQHADVLHISINGLHRWSPQFEAHIWKHLGWDDWSDFTLCSVTCGKGVQQRFRRCLLDNPMMNLNMNMNFNNNDDDDDDDVDEDVTEDDVSDDNGLAGYVAFVGAEQQPHLASDSAHVSPNGNANPTMEVGPPPATSPLTPTNMNAIELKSGIVTGTSHESNWRSALAKNTNNTLITRDVGVGVAVDELFGVSSSSSAAIDNNELKNDSSRAQSEGDVMRLSEGLLSQAGRGPAYVRNNDVNDDNDDARHKRKRKHRKASKTLSTLFCEGYNIEQRNCNTFECSDDISDLLKFYKRLPTPYDDAGSSSAQVPTTSTSSQSMDSNASPTASKQNSRDDYVDTGRKRDDDGAALPSATSSATSTPTTSGGAYANGSQQAMASSTPANMGYIKFWHNSLNFTLMLTMRVKNDSRKATATIFSIRNATHNLYLESCKGGLRLYLERDNSTEMLPVKFNLYDYRWHQVAISIQNGDFISIYVDCSWTNSFVVSKRLFSLPLDADVEIGRGFNGELQQLLVLPGNQERHQCSSKRTSINEVKRYIIDTFIDDYSN